MWLRGLLSKVRAIGIKGKLFNWLFDYLSDRRQRVVLDGVKSNWASVKAGVPQGSVLGPLLFLVYINDLTDNIVSNIRLFADDTMIFQEVNNVQETARILNNDLQTINTWSKKWIVNFSVEKLSL